MSCAFLFYITKSCYLVCHFLTQSQFEESDMKLTLRLAIVLVEYYFFLTPRPSGDLHPQGSVGEEFHGSKGTSCLRNPLLEAEEGPVEHLNHSVSGWYQSVPSWADSPDAQSSLPQVQSSRNMSGEKWGEWRSNRAEWGDLALQLLC